MRRSTTVQLTTRTAKLSEQFGYDYAVRLFGKEAIDGLPLLTAGPNKGKIKGYLVWRKALTAGYCREISGAVAVGGLVDAWIGEHQGTLRNDAVWSHWINRTQPLAGGRDVLTASYRENELRLAAEYKAEIEEMRKEAGL